ncbi:bifunctional metallophosphatase/5'-nucleotidase [Metabacillus malikii]|uniref:2',3'-cyclic-nucleotide 2'-phosphodiesterase (5'-nucleotidase family) n=1 Tax=Metabacillus malikii TaxID=1504265 RepID=A0ABT9ZDQ4_9BACI|nr:bifunctional UDP-sugar hydrolase/5'-nucleotidase [Metabacillus malikii]MDQ0229713.1 2',3'-cyclic-nucleotide 2'-phosphodiesterase (5'-nucleotidase family) [Metabacillus malikii]
MLETIHLYHTNDLHSHFENWPKIVHFLNEKRKTHTIKNEETLLFDIGDHADRFHPITEATKGKANVTLLNQLKYDAVTIGNNEGITFSHEDLDTLYEKADFPVILSNLYTELNERPPWVVPYKIFTLNSGIKLAVLGVTVYYELFYQLLGWKVKDPFQSLLETVQQVKEQADVIVLLSHLGITDDEIIANEFPDIDVIIGGHTHHVLKNGKKINQTLIAGAGKYGQYVGQISLTIDDQSKDVVSSTATVYPIDEAQAACEATQHWLDNALHKSNDILSEVIVNLNQKLEINWYEESPFAKFLAQALLEWCDGEVAMVNSGVLLESLAKGPVTKGDLHRLCPHPINPCKVFLKGDVLKEVIIQARAEELEHLMLRGFGFRGKVMGRMVYEGIEFTTTMLSDGKEHLNEIFVQGEPINTERTYAVATIDMFTFGAHYPQIARAEDKVFYMPELLRDLLAWQLEKSTC